MSATTSNLFDTSVQDLLKDKKVSINYSLIAEKDADKQVKLDKLDQNGWVINNGNLSSEHVSVLKDKSNNLIAVINSYKATDSKLLQKYNVAEKQLENCWFIDSIWISPDVPVSKIIPLALYSAIKEARINFKDIVLTVKNVKSTFPIMTFLKGQEVKKIDENNILLGQKVEYALFNLANDLPEDASSFITQEFVSDMYKMFFLYNEKFNNGAWCKAIYNRTMTKNQYISSHFNLHSYVEHTTRICARAIAFCGDLFLRNNYIEHFKGEVNHEILIQKDLVHLGVDVDYLKNYYIPNTKTKGFMALQESTIGFYQDPVLLLACPFVAEGISAHFDDDLLVGMEELITSWGVSEPEKAMRFWSSHVKFDGGDDGHWEDVMSVIPRYVKTEHERQKFISIAKFAMDSLYNSFNSNIEENLIW